MDDKQFKRSSGGSMRRFLGFKTPSRSNSIKEESLPVSIGAPVLVGHSTLDQNLLTPGQPLNPSMLNTTTMPVKLPQRRSSKLASHDDEDDIPMILTTSSGKTLPLIPIASANTLTPKTRRSSASTRRISMRPGSQQPVLPDDYLEKINLAKKGTLPSVNEVEVIEEAPVENKRKSVNKAFEALVGRSSATVGPSVYLQIGNQVKKTRLGSGAITMARIRERFATEFKQIPPGDEPGVPPALYIKDLIAGVYYEIDSPEDVKEGSVIRFGRQDASEELQKEFREKIVQLSEEIAAIRTLVVERTSAAPPPPVSSKGSSDNDTQQIRLMQREIGSLRADLSSVKHTHAEFRYQASEIIKKVRQQSEGLKEGNSGKGGARVLISSGIEELDSQTEVFASKLEEIQEVISELRVDITTRGSKPSQICLETVRTTLSDTGRGLASLSDRVNRIRPEWKKIWEDELIEISKEQAFISEQQDLLEDLEEDQRNLSTIFQQIETVVELQPERQPRDFELDVVSAEDAKDEIGSVINEIKLIAPDSDRRLQAMAKSEKMRNWEKDGYQDDFSRELGRFVGGSQLRKKGIHDVERRREEQRQLAIAAALNKS